LASFSEELKLKLTTDHIENLPVGLLSRRPRQETSDRNGRSIRSETMGRYAYDFPLPGLNIGKIGLGIDGCTLSDSRSEIISFIAMIIVDGPETEIF
jgi:hypothetical protein